MNSSSVGRLGFAALLAIAATSDADAKPRPNTLLLGDLGDGSKLWLMQDSVRQDESAIRHGWTIIDYPAPQTTQGVEYRSDASKFYVKCQSQEITLANAIKFDGAMGGGKNVFQVNSEPTPEPVAADYHPVRPNTAEQVVASAICKQKIR
ncbi:MAG TPA: surface-adhesin E family protein [Caulobacteraceae bacterium]|jgi:hypothetical protein|nr:surface-adhesin E family protein [Caulobacteraceae bacterium]